MRPANVILLTPMLTALLALPAAAGPPSEPPSEPRSEPRSPVAAFSDRIDVTLSTVDVRVVDGMRRPVSGLGAGDFRVRVDGEPVDVVAVDWIPAPEDPAYEPLDTAAGPPAGELRFHDLPERTVFLFQAGLAPGKAIGHLRMLPRLQELVRELPAGTLAAVVSFHSHLTLHQDLTTDRKALAAAMDLGRGYHHARLPAPATGRPSLARHLDGEAMRRVVDPAHALELVTRALAAEPGQASVVYVGWSLEGDMAMQARMLDVLLATGTPLFVIDVTDADFHTLEAGLRYTARQTGGHYSNTRDFPGREIRRLRNLLVRGHYRVTVQHPDLPGGVYPLQVTLKGWAGYRRVLAPRHLTVGRRGEGTPLR